MSPDEMRRAAAWLSDTARFLASPECAALARLLREEADSQGWQPIETAPRDGTEIDVCCSDNAEGYRVTNAWWCVLDSRWRCYTDGGLIWASQPTHWRPLPPPPQGRGG